MAIDGGRRDKLQAGTKLTAKYRGREYATEVLTGEDGKARYRLEDGREFSGPSAAGSAVMNGIACNGWRFWSLAESAQSEAAPETAVETNPSRGAAGKPSRARHAAKDAAAQ